MFPRARIQRFNEVCSDVPPPGAYDPKFDNRLKGVGMDKMPDRFVEPKPMGPAESNIQRSASLNCLPVFRTPQLPKKSSKICTQSAKVRPETPSSVKVRRNIEKELGSSDTMSSGNDQLTYLQEQLDLTQKKLEDSLARCKMLENDIAVDKNSIEELELEKSDLSKELESLMVNLSEETKKVSDMNEQFHLLDSNLAERKAAVAELEQSQTEMLLEISVLKERIAQNTIEVDQSVQRCEELENALSEANAQNEAMMQTHSSLSAEIADLADRLNEATMQIQARDEHCETLEHAKRDLLTSLDEKTQAFEILEQQIKDSDKRCTDLTSLFSETQARAQELENINTNLKDLAGDLECRLDVVTADLQACQAKCEALDAEIEVQKQIISQMEDTKIALCSELQQMRALLQRTETSLSDTQKSLDEAQTLAAVEQESRSKLEGELQELSVLCAELELKLQQRQQLILGLQADLSSSSCELEEAARRAEEYRAEIERICTKHVEELSGVRQELEARVAQAQAEHELELASLRDLAYKLEQHVLEERDANCRLSRKHQDLAAAEQQLREAVLSLQEEKRRAEEHIATLTRDSEIRIAEIERSTRTALEEAEVKLCAAEAAYTETLKQVHEDTQSLLKASRVEALEELERMKEDSEHKVRTAQEEVSTVSDKLREVQEELHQVIAVRDNLKSSDIEKQVTIVELQDRVVMMELERAESVRMLEEAEEKLKNVTSELDLMKKIRRNLEIIGQETLATVNAVSMRLLESDDEVERLSQVNSVLETNLNEQKESLTSMEKDNIREIEETRTHLLYKLEAFKQKCVHENTKLQEQIEILQESVVMYADQLSEANKNVEALEEDRNEQAIIIADLQQTTNELQATQDFLATQMDDYISLKKSCKALKEEVEEHKDQLVKARAEAADGEMEIQHREKQIAELANQIDDLNDKITELQGVILELETAGLERDHLFEQLECKLEFQKECDQKANWQISDLSKENEGLRSAMDQLHNEIKQQKLDSKQQIESLSCTKYDLQSQIESMNTVLECHKMNVLKATERIESLDSTVALKETEIKEMRYDMKQLETDLLSKSNKIADLSSLVKAKENALLSSHQAIDGLLNNMKSNEKQIQDLSDHLAGEKAFRVECELKLTEVLQDKLDYEVLIEDVKEKVLELESEISDKNVLISSLEKAIEESSKEIEVLKAEAEQSLYQIAEAEKNIIILEADRVGMREDIVSLTSKVTDQWNIIEKQQSEISTLNAEIQTQIDLVKYLKDRLEENRKEIGKLEAEKVALQSENNTLKMQVEVAQWEAQEALQEEKKKCSTLVAEVESLGKQLKTLELEIQTEKSSAQEREEILNEEISSLKVSLGAKTQEVGTIKGHQQQLEAELDQTARRKETYKAAVVELQQAVKQSRSRMQTLEEELKNVRMSVVQEREEHERKMEETRVSLSCANEWKERCEELEALIGPFREQLEAFESERHALEIRKEAAEGEVKELAMRYAQVLGHQNHKQKIHHVVKLKEQILDLKKENEKLESQNRSQKRTIDKLKDDLSRFSSSTRFNPAMAFKCHDDSLQTRLSLAQSKSLLESSSLSKSVRAPAHQSTAKKGKENISMDISTPLSSRPSAKVKDELLSPVRHHSPVGSPITPLKEVQNQQ